MSLRSDLNKLEKELDNMDPDDPRYEELNERANELVDKIEAITAKAAEEIRRAKQRKLEEERAAELLFEAEETIPEEVRDEEE